MNEPAVIHAYAKINLALDVLGKRGDGYHDLDMLMQCISLHDTLSLTCANETSLEISGDMLIDPADNIILKAHSAVERFVGYELPCAYKLEKHIPVAAGLGGGSADAAAAIIALDELYSLGFTADEMLGLGAKVGSDVPFCLAGRTGGVFRVTGRGEKLSKTNADFKAHLLMIRPCDGLSTKQVFDVFDGQSSANCDHPHTVDMLIALHDRDFDAVKRFSGNALKLAAQSLRPEIGGAIEKLYGQGAAFADMSGSGPCVYGIFADEQSAARARHSLEECYPEVFACNTL